MDETEVLERPEISSDKETAPEEAETAAEAPANTAEASEAETGGAVGDIGNVGVAENDENNDVIDPQTSMNVDIYVSEYIEEFTGEAGSETKRIIAETAEENERLNSVFIKPKPEQAPQKQKEKKPYTIGVLSAAASLIYIGTVLLITLLSPVDAFKAIYFAPAILIFIGAEAVFAVVSRKSFHIALDIKSMIICLVLIVITFILSAIAKSETPADVQRVYASGRIKSIISRDISEVLSCDYIRTVSAEVTLCADDPAVYSSPDDLIVGDTVDITVYFSDAQMTIREFAADCRRTLDELATLGYNFGEVKFITEDSVNRYNITVNWLYQQNYDEMKLAAEAAYFGDNIYDSDIADIEDYEED